MCKGCAPFVLEQIKGNFLNILLLRKSVRFQYLKNEACTQGPAMTILINERKTKVFE